MRKLLVKHKLKYAPKETAKPALDVFNAATLAQRLTTLEADKEQCSQQQQEERLRNVQLRLELQEAKAALQQAQHALDDIHRQHQTRISTLEQALETAEAELNHNVGILQQLATVRLCCCCA